jgi:hypothetical protein
MSKKSIPSHPGADEAAQSLRRDKSIFFFGSGVSVTMEPSIARRLFRLLQSEARKLGVEVSDISARSQETRAPSSLPDFRYTKNFRKLLYYVSTGNCRLLIGSGVSSEAGMPDMQALQEALLAEVAAYGGSVRADPTLPAIATALEREIGRASLVDVLQRKFQEALREQPWDRGAYPWIPRLRSSLINEIFTTNWDDLLRRIFEESNKLVREIQYDESVFVRSARVPHFIFKVNGDILGKPDTLIITEADYSRAESSLDDPETLWGYAAGEFRKYSFVFVGFGADDPNWALIRQALTDRLHHFLVAPMATETAAYLEPLGLLPVVATAADFFQALEAETRLGED